MLCVAGIDGYLKRVNPAWVTILGYTEAELLSRPYADFVYSDDIEATRAAAATLFEGRPVEYFENRYVHQDGSLRWLQWAAAPVQPGERVIIAAARDITERKAAAELRARTTNLELLDELLATVIDSGDLPDVFGRISEIARKVLPHDALGLPILLPDGRNARRYASVGFEVVVDPGILPFPEEFLKPGWEYDLTHDVTTHPAAYNERSASMGFRSALRVPIRLERRTAGVLAFLSKAPSAFKHADILVARRIADRIALTLARDREIAAPGGRTRQPSGRSSSKRASER